MSKREVDFDAILASGMIRLGLDINTPANDRSIKDAMKMKALYDVLADVFPLTFVCAKEEAIDLIRTVADMIELADGE